MKERRKSWPPFMIPEKIKVKIMLGMMKGRTIRQIAQIYNVPEGAIRRYATKWSPENYRVDENTGMGHKDVPYYEKEMEYAPKLKYKLKDLSVDEIDIYLEGN